MTRIVLCISLPLALLLCSTGTVLTQSHYHDMWYFGDSLGLDFRQGSPVPVAGISNTFEGCASICDPYTGRNLFYTNGDVIRNRNHAVMKNGAGLFGNLSATQAALIVPDPASTHRYFLFTLDGNTSGGQRPAAGLGLNYSIVDMRGDNGAGEVTDKNVRLLSTAGEKLVGVRRRGGSGFWVVTHELGNNRFHAWLLNESGVLEAPVISDVGLTYDQLDIGYLKASPDGTMLFALHSYSTHAGELFRFNPFTGRVEELLAQLVMPYPVYGASFSPDNNYLYVGEGSNLVQYDLRRRPDAIARKVIGPAVGGGAIYGLQLASDRRIYLIQEYDSTLHIGVIAQPNVPESGCDFRPDPGLPSQRVISSIPFRYMGFPNCIDGYFEDTSAFPGTDTGCTPKMIRLRVDRDYRAKTDVPIEIPVRLVEPVETSDIAELEFELEYDPGIMHVQPESVARLLDGTVLQGWSVAILASGRGRLMLRLTAPPGTTLSGNGVLLRFEGLLYLSGVRATELPFTVRSSSRCYAFQTEAGYAELNVCGLNFRLIELTTGKYVPPTAYPNPASDRVAFEFGLGLDGPTRLEVFDVLGNRIGLVLDDVLESGRYAVEMNVRDLPSGIYWYRLMSGDWSEGGQVRVRE